MTYLRSCVCFKGSLSAFPFASFCGGGTAGWSLLAVPRHRVNLALTVSSHPKTLTGQSPGLPPPMGTNPHTSRVSNAVVSSRFHFYISL